MSETSDPRLDAQPHLFDAQMLDALTEAVVMPDDPRVRAEVISDLVQEIDDVVRWRHQPGVGEEELRSLDSVVQAAAQHVLRMTEVSEDSSVVQQQVS